MPEGSGALLMGSQSALESDLAVLTARAKARGMRGDHYLLRAGRLRS